MPTKLSKKDTELLENLRSRIDEPNFLSKVNNKRLFKIMCFLYIYDKREYSKIVKKILNYFSNTIKHNIDDVNKPKNRKYPLDLSNLPPAAEDDEQIPHMYPSEIQKSKVLTHINFSSKMSKTELPKISNSIIKSKKPNFTHNVQFKLEGSEVKRGYGVVIHETDYHQLKINRRVTKNVFDYYMGYILEQHQQNDDQLLEHYKLRLLIYKTNLMDLYTDNYMLEPIESHFSNVVTLTSHINSKNRSILNTFDLIMIPFVEGIYGFKLVLVDIANKSLRLYDPLKVNKMTDRHHYNYKYIDYALNYINDEYFFVTGDRLENNWSIYENEITCLDNFALGGLYVCFFAHCILKGNLFPVNSHSIIDIFYDKLLEIIGDQTSRLR